MADRSANEIVAAAHSAMRDKESERLLVEFAAAALTGLLSGRPTVPLPEQASGLAYLYADAMLAEREARIAARKETPQ